VFKSGDTVTGTLKMKFLDCKDDDDILNIGQNAININIGKSDNNDTKTINIGGLNDTVNIMGQANYVKSTNIEV